jgi:hypothetical protein
MSVDARRSMSDQLRAVGFGDVTMLSQAAPVNPDERGPRFVAA